MRSMAAGEKPYRVYKGGRTKGKVPLQGRPAREREARRRGSAPGNEGDGSGQDSDECRDHVRQRANSGEPECIVDEDKRKENDGRKRQAPGEC